MLWQLIAEKEKERGRQAVGKGERSEEHNWKLFGTLLKLLRLLTCVELMVDLTENALL